MKYIAFTIHFLYMIFSWTLPWTLKSNKSRTWSTSSRKNWRTCSVCLCGHHFAQLNLNGHLAPPLSLLREGGSPQATHSRQGAWPGQKNTNTKLWYLQLPQDITANSESIYIYIFFVCCQSHILSFINKHSPKLPQKKYLCYLSPTALTSITITFQLFPLQL